MVGPFLSATLLFTPTSSDAMSKSGQARYVTELFGSSVEMLWKQGRKEEAQKIMDLFNTQPGDRMSQALMKW